MILATSSWVASSHFTERKRYRAIHDQHDDQTVDHGYRASMTESQEQCRGDGQPAAEEVEGYCYYRKEADGPGNFLDVANDDGAWATKLASIVDMSLDMKGLACRLSVQLACWCQASAVEATRQAIS